MYEIPNYQEVIDKSHPFDGGKLEVEPLLERLVLLGRNSTVPLLEALLTEAFKIRERSEPLRHIEVREFVLVKCKCDVTLLRDQRRVVYGLRRVGEERSHLVLRLEVELASLIAHPVGVADLSLGLDAEQHIVRSRVLRICVMHVVRGDKRDPGFARHPDELLVYERLLGNAVVLKLEVKVAFPEYVEHPESRLLGFVIETSSQVVRYLPRKTRRKRDHTLVELFEDL